MDIIKTRIILKPDPKKVLLRSFQPSSENQLRNIISRILSLTEKEVKNEFEKIDKEFSGRHRDNTGFFLTRFNDVSGYMGNTSGLSKERKLLLGASLSMEYSIESTALFNPAMVWHPDQSNLPSGHKRFIISLRATGEGHISSIVFRQGIIDSENNIAVEEPGRFVTSPDSVTFNEDGKSHSEYEICYEKEVPLSERIIFPRSAAESNGIEDARFMQFKDDDGSSTYYATYTAYDGMKIQSQLLETKDFLHFNISKLSGPEVKNKGMALFPEKIKGQYAMLSRQDNENNFIMFSDDLYFWDTKKMITKPAFYWETVQSGNCGSPIRTEKGWLALTHGVGPVRKYSIGAMLLDRDDPARVLGRLKEPLVSADETEREGYVPNVVYTCGSIINGNELIIPYAMSDYASSFARVNLPALLNELVS